VGSEVQRQQISLSQQRRHLAFSTIDTGFVSNFKSHRHAEFHFLQLSALFVRLLKLWGGDGPPCILLPYMPLQRTCRVLLLYLGTCVPRTHSHAYPLQPNWQSPPVVAAQILRHPFTNKCLRNVPCAAPAGVCRALRYIRLWAPRAFNPSHSLLQSVANL